MQFAASNTLFQYKNQASALPKSAANLVIRLDLFDKIRATEGIKNTYLVGEMLQLKENISYLRFDPA
jgi:hypothetical protein